ncbi:hypothetical protein POTOM_007462 [Populus tomentosa]|uniref:Uncharacterized protein n=1 Tax=Populus tomentosa TaxID=118781 RepID=A0A8X8D3C2_POPTO|nr:hypothetical protein POTOM_007462 [Populus tomentosa]
MDSGVGSSDQQFLHGFRSSDGFLNQGEMQGDRLHRAAILVRKRNYGALERIYLAWGILKADRLDYNPGGTGAGFAVNKDLSNGATDGLGLKFEKLRMPPKV